MTLPFSCEVFHHCYIKRFISVDYEVMANFPYLHALRTTSVHCNQFKLKCVHKKAQGFPLAQRRHTTKAIKSVHILITCHNFRELVITCLHFDQAQIRMEAARYSPGQTDVAMIVSWYFQPA